MAEPRTAGHALITGASRGIGREIALRLASDGFEIAVHYGRDREAAEEVAAEIVANGGRGFVVGGDLGEPQDLSRIVEELASTWAEGDRPFLDVLVNNAGTFAQGDLHSTSPRDFDHVLKINTRGTFFLIQQVAPKLRDHGRVIVISSTAARLAEQDFVAYSMSKAALETLTRAAAKELGPRGITVNAIAPGWIETDLNRAFWRENPEVPAAAADRTALRRTGLPDDIAGVASFFAGPDAKFITGVTLEASGGYALGG
ncbi:MAG: SDR family oxidoreductase [Planctomycetota bacterium]